MLMPVKNLRFIIFFFSAAFSACVFSETETISNNVGNDSDDSFWLLEDYQPLFNSLWLYGGIDEESGGYYGLSSQLAINTSVYFDLSATQQNYDFKTDDFSWGFSSKLSEQFNWAVSRTFWGQKDTLEKTDSRFSVSYFSENFTSRLSYETGKVELFFNQPSLLQINSLTSDHKAIELSLGYSWQQIYSELRYKQHDYQARQPELVRRPIVFSLVNSIGLQQARNLAAREAAVLIGLQQHTVSYELLFSQIDSAFSDERFTYASLSLLKALNSQWQTGINIEIPLDEGLFTAGISLGYRW
ncbi:hypothetical protein MNBD_GAMMA11-106 [hydrothermal vent metagenome]|uniref:Uncharacterized protein n=1 Tax=hydrothermal vent metagenome TaxID=652676 RepID=A0A3B0XU04_9ZZZZ